ncbi:MAG: hypothetical protein GY862_24870 [Gammaproteobacteria bacterium]|nr:hypothetical protein [Gammaproteobacteria bacterium]
MDSISPTLPGYLQASVARVEPAESGVGYPGFRSKRSLGSCRMGRGAPRWWFGHGLSRAETHHLEADIVDDGFRRGKDCWRISNSLARLYPSYGLFRPVSQAGSL